MKEFLKERIIKLVDKFTKFEVFFPVIVVVFLLVKINDEQLVVLFTDPNWLLYLVAIPGVYTLRGYAKAKASINQSEK